jgi:hypothetical protein
MRLFDTTGIMSLTAQLFASIPLDLVVQLEQTEALLSRNQARKELIEQISTTLPTETTSWSSVASTRVVLMTAPSSRTGTCSTLTTKETNVKP